MSLQINGVVRLTSDIEIKPVTKGVFVNFGIASQRGWAKEGYQNVDHFKANIYYNNERKGQIPDIQRGDMVYLRSAELKNDEFVNPEGEKRNAFKINIFKLDVLNMKKEVKQQESIGDTETTGFCEDKTRTDVKVTYKKVDPPRDPVETRPPQKPVVAVKKKTPITKQTNILEDFPDF